MPTAQRVDPPAVAAAKAILANEKYVRPPEEIARLVTAPRQQNAVLTDPSPDRRWMLREVAEGMPSVSTFGRQHLYFAGLQVDPGANRSRVLTNRGAVGLEMVDLASGRTVRIETPAGAKVSGRCMPILMPVQPLSLWLAVTMATPSTSSSNWAK